MPRDFSRPLQAEEFALAYDRGRRHRLLVLPALFDEGNKLRHLTVDVVRKLDKARIDCFLPDYPGLNESSVPLASQTLETWRKAIDSYCRQFRPTHVLAIRAGAALAPEGLSGWAYSPIGGSNALRALLRARIIGSREAGIEETSQGLLEIGRKDGLDLAGYEISPGMIRELEHATLPEESKLQTISQPAVGGAGLWLRAEPDFIPDQAEALAAYIVMKLRT
jgi:hypothetical protein